MGCHRKGSSGCRDTSCTGLGYGNLELALHELEEHLAVGLDVRALQVLRHQVGQRGGQARIQRSHLLCDALFVWHRYWLVVLLCRGHVALRGLWHPSMDGPIHVQRQHPCGTRHDGHLVSLGFARLDPLRRGGCLDFHPELPTWLPHVHALHHVPHHRRIGVRTSGGHDRGVVHSLHHFWHLHLARTRCDADQQGFGPFGPWHLPGSGLLWVRFQRDLLWPCWHRGQQRHTMHHHRRHFGFRDCQCHFGAESRHRDAVAGCLHSFLFHSGRGPLPRRDLVHPECPDFHSRVLHLVSTQDLFPYRCLGGVGEGL
mmetsp:Transcript_69705/g.145659  ORF Transcript_69705/g.145659 Transcript_69705/m.145659 type:complete len:313 (+) Transcript_69705:277-1215(+)